jgi:molybdopterin converting factor small subunit
MTVQIRFYGDLRDKIKGRQDAPGGARIIHVDSTNIKDVSDILNKYSIKKDEISHIFVNHTYAGPGKKVADGDRVSIFAKNQALLYKWYFHKEED